MNRENLKKMADFIATIPKEFFNMAVKYRSGDKKGAYCDSIGCIIGLCTVLDRPKNLPRFSNGNIDFTSWSEQFTGLKGHSPEWDWCFSQAWVYRDNTQKGASKRIKYLLDHGLPADWKEQMAGAAPLSYLQYYEKSRIKNIGRKS